MQDPLVAPRQGSSATSYGQSGYSSIASKSTHTEHRREERGGRLSHTTPEVTGLVPFLSAQDPTGLGLLAPSQVRALMQRTCSVEREKIERRQAGRLPPKIASDNRLTTYVISHEKQWDQNPLVTRPSLGNSGLPPVLS